jgi:hypothetical protein
VPLCRKCLCLQTDIEHTHEVGEVAVQVTHLEVKLHRGALEAAAQRVEDRDVDLGAWEDQGGGKWGTSGNRQEWMESDGKPRNELMRGNESYSRGRGSRCQEEGQH